MTPAAPLLAFVTASLLEALHAPVWLAWTWAALGVALTWANISDG